jgi:hypothetical protein
VRSAGGFPQRRAAGGRDPGWCRRLTEVVEDVAHGRAVGDEGDDPHLGAAERAAEWEDGMRHLPVQTVPMVTVVWFDSPRRNPGLVCAARAPPKGLQGRARASAVVRRLSWLESSSL